MEEPLPKTLAVAVAAGKAAPKALGVVVVAGDAAPKMLAVVGAADEAAPPKIPEPDEAPKMLGAVAVEGEEPPKMLGAEVEAGEDESRPPWVEVEETTWLVPLKMPCDVDVGGLAPPPKTLEELEVDVDDPAPKMLVVEVVVVVVGVPKTDGGFCTPPNILVEVGAGTLLLSKMFDIEDPEVFPALPKILGLAAVDLSKIPLETNGPVPGFAKMLGGAAGWLSSSLGVVPLALDGAVSHEPNPKDLSSSPETLIPVFGDENKAPVFWDGRDPWTVVVITVTAFGADEVADPKTFEKPIEVPLFGTVGDELIDGEV